MVLVLNKLREVFLLSCFVGLLYKLNIHLVNEYYQNVNIRSNVSQSKCKSFWIVNFTVHAFSFRTLICFSTTYTLHTISEYIPQDTKSYFVVGKTVCGKYYHFKAN